MTPHILMLVITIITLCFIGYCFLFNKWTIGAFIAVFIQSILLFNIRYFWQDKAFGDAFIHSFDLITIVIVIIFAIYKINKDKSSE